jgi:hypothetical protein
MGEAVFGSASNASCVMPGGGVMPAGVVFYQQWAGNLTVTGNVNLGAVTLQSAGNGELDNPGVTVTMSSLNWTGDSINSSPTTMGTVLVTGASGDSLISGAPTRVTGTTLVVSGGVLDVAAGTTVQFNNGAILTIQNTNTELDTTSGAFTQGVAGAGYVSLLFGGRWVAGDPGGQAEVFDSALSLYNEGGLFSALPNQTITFSQANQPVANVGNCTILNYAIGTSAPGGYKLGFCVNDGASVRTAGNIYNTGDFFSWAGATAGTTYIRATNNNQGYGFYMGGGNLWADYNCTSGVGTLYFAGMSGTFTGGTINVGVWEGGGNNPSNGSTSVFTFERNVNIGTRVTSVAGYTIALPDSERVSNGQSSLFLLTLFGTPSGSFVSNSIPINDESGHNWSIRPGSLGGPNNPIVGWNILTSW